MLKGASTILSAFGGKAGGCNEVKYLAANYRRGVNIGVTLQAICELLRTAAPCFGRACRS